MIATKIDRNIIKVNLYNTSIQISKPVGSNPMTGKLKITPKKKPITKYTQKSNKNCRLWYAVHGEKLDRVIHLTYPSYFPTNGRQAQRDLKVFLQWLIRQGVKVYIWHKEYQDRGAVHYHIPIDKTFIKKEELTKKWNKIILAPQGTPSTKIEKIKNHQALAKYHMNYFRKKDQKTVPDFVENSGRFWGSNLKVQSTDSFQIKFENKKDRDACFRVLEKKYTTMLKEWGNKIGRTYKRSRKGNGYTVHQEGQRIESVILALVTQYPIQLIQPLYQEDL